MDILIRIESTLHQHMLQSVIKRIYKLQHISAYSLRMSTVEEVCTAIHDHQASIWRPSE